MSSVNAPGTQVLGASFERRACGGDGVDSDAHVCGAAYRDELMMGRSEMGVPGGVPGGGRRGERNVRRKIGGEKARKEPSMGKLRGDVGDTNTRIVREKRQRSKQEEQR